MVVFYAHSFKFQCTPVQSGKSLKLSYSCRYWEVLEYCAPEKLRPWNVEWKLRSWNIKVLKCWWLEILRSMRSFEVYEVLEVLEFYGVFEVLEVWEVCEFYDVHDSILFLTPIIFQIWQELWSADLQWRCFRVQFLTDSSWIEAQFEHFYSSAVCSCSRQL